jgi:protein arginine kinase
MRQTPKDTESWKRMVLRSQAKPAWLGEDAPHVDVVLSSRTRVMRNLTGHKFPGKAEVAELQDIMQKVLASARESGLELEVFKGLTNAERDYLVGCRLVSHDFEWTLPARALLMDSSRTISMMVNEEDHIRAQALTAGWSVQNSDALATSLLEHLERRLSFSWSPRFGYLSASPYNSGIGRRQSSMFHLIGLATAKRLPNVMRALASKGIVVRGLFGESSRAIGAFVQVSVVSGTREDFIGACEYLLKEERDARAAISRDHVTDRTNQARDFVVGSRSVSLADSLRTIAWFRWATAVGVLSGPLRRIDEALTMLELRGAKHEDDASRERAQTLRSMLTV